MVVSKGGMVEHTGHILQNLLNRDIRMLPCIDDTWRDILKYTGSDLPGGWVENVRKVVFGKEGVCGV